jgi:hypothetical protein
MAFMSYYSVALTVDRAQTEFRVRYLVAANHGRTKCSGHTHRNIVDDGLYRRHYTSNS